MRPVLANLEDAAAVDRMEVAIARALDSAQRAEGLGERDIFVSGWGVINTTDLATAFRLRAERIKADMERYIAAVTVKTEAAVDAVEAVGLLPAVGGSNDDTSGISSGNEAGGGPRRGPGRPRRAPEPGAV